MDQNATAQLTEVVRAVAEKVRRYKDTADKALVRVIRRKTAKLTPKEIADSLRRLDVRIESPTPLQDTISNWLEENVMRLRITDAIIKII